MTDDPRSPAGTDRFARVVAGLGAVFFVVFGLWAMVDPRSFFDTVATFDPYNQHLIQDIGAFQIGLGVVLALALAFERTGPLAVCLLGVGLGSGAHLVSHLVGTDLGGSPETDIPFFAIMTGLLLAAGLLHWRRAGARSGG